MATTRNPARSKVRQTECPLRFTDDQGNDGASGGRQPDRVGEAIGKEQRARAARWSSAIISKAASAAPAEAGGKPVV